jgi:microcystin-dependent protein
LLYDLLGTTYGGDGNSTFAVPDLQGRTPLGAGPSNPAGEQSGSESLALTADQIGTHTHPIRVSASVGAVAIPDSTLVLGQGGASQVNVYAPPPATTSLSALSIGPTRSAAAAQHENRQPFLALNYIIAAQGLFPTQD